MKCSTTISNGVGTGLKATAVITGSLSIPAFATGQVLSIGISLSGMNILLPLTNAAFQKSSESFAVKQELIKSIKLLAHYSII